MENPEEFMKNVACVVFSRDNYSVYLVDLATKKLRGFVHLNDDFPFTMATIVLKSKLYLFGGDLMEPGDIHLRGLPDAYVLDLFELAKSTSDDGPKPLPSKLPSMNWGKYSPIALAVGHKICVFDSVTGLVPAADCTFEVFEPDQNTWNKVPDPIHLKRGSLVDGHFVKDNKLFVSIRHNPGIYVLDFGISSSPIWSHYDAIHGVKCLPYAADGVQIGTLVLTLYEAFDLADERGFARKLPVLLTGDTVDKGYYDVCHGLDAAISVLGPDKVLTIRAELLREPRPKRIKSKMLVTGRKPWVLHPVLRKCRQQPVLRKCHSKKGINRFVVSVRSVDRDPTARPIQLKVLQSFTVPMMMYYPPCACPIGRFRTVSLCDP